jgi:lysozyme
MKISEAGLTKLIKREGIRYKAYKDTKGIWTIGVGHTGPEVKEGLVWSWGQVMDTLKRDILHAEDAVNRYVGVPLEQHQFDALVSFVFNVGASAFNNSTLLKLLNEKLYDLAGLAFMMWNKPPEIISRRKSEQLQFLNQ